MKALRYFLLMLMAGVLLSGCEKDTPLFEDQEDVELKSAQAPIPFKSNNRAVYHPEIPGRYMIHGTATHAGKLNPQESFYQFTSMVPTEIDGEMFMYLEGYGKMVGANGHGMEFTFWSYQTLDYTSYHGQIILTPGSGTGQFTGATGILNSSGGALPEDDFVFNKITGYLVYN